MEQKLSFKVIRDVLPAQAAAANRTEAPFVWRDNLCVFAKVAQESAIVPDSVRIRGREYPVKSLFELLNQVVKVVLVAYRRQFLKEVKRRSPHWFRVGGRNGGLVVLEPDAAPSTIFLRIRLVLQWAGMSERDVTVAYRKRQSELTKPTRQPMQPPRALLQPLKEGESRISLRADKIDAIPFEGSAVVRLELDRKIVDVGAWSDVLLRIVDYIFDENSYRLSVAAEKESIRHWLGYSMFGMKRPKRHLSGFFVETGDIPSVLLSHAVDILNAVGMANVEVNVVVRCEVPRTPPLPRDTQRQHLPEEHLTSFKDIIKSGYPNGFDFKETSRRLVGERVGKSFGDAEADRLKGQMFQCADGLWLFSDMVISDDALRRMKERARGFLSEDGYFSMDALHAEFEAEMRNIDVGRDFDALFAKFVAGDVRGVVRGHGEWRVCFAASMSEASGWETIVRRIREVLKDCGDAVSVEDIIVQMPSLVRGVVVRLAREHMEDAVVFDAGGVEYIKLLESYYLPDDFSEVVSGFVETTEASQNVVSVVLLEAELDGRYGEGFRVNYGLEDDSVFKQVVAKSFTGKDHGWNRDMFTRNGQGINVIDEFVNLRKGVFHEEEFFGYAHEKRGLDNHASLVCQYLRTRCIRLNRTMWISVDDFTKRGILDADSLNNVKLFLKSQLGTSSMLHIGLIPDMVIASLPPVSIEGCKYPWNAYSLTSVAKHLIKELNIVNDEPSPYYVTAILLPDGVDVDRQGIVEHVFEVCKTAGLIPQSADEAFDYLKARQVRMTKTLKLMEKIRAYWSF